MITRKVKKSERIVKSYHGLAKRFSS